MARKINRVMGGPVIAPWETEELPEEWLMVMRGYADVLPGMQAANQKIEAYFADARRAANYK